MPVAAAEASNPFGYVTEYFPNSNIVSLFRIRLLAGFLKCFVPSGAPLPLLVILIPIEVISFFSRVFALAIRLFANVLAGHILIFALLSMVVLFGWAAFPVVFMVVGIYFFEIFMAMLQAYIFSLLSAIFISQMAYEGH